MANIFPEVFQNEVPCATVTLAATAVYIFFHFNTPFHMLNHMQIKVALDEV